MKIITKATEDTPQISFDAENNSIFFEGKSYPEDAKGFYEALIQDVLERALIKDREINIYINIVYFNSSSLKMMYEFIHFVIKNTKKVKIVWHYEAEDEDMCQEGEIVKDLFREKLGKRRVDFQVIPS